MVEHFRIVSGVVSTEVGGEITVLDPTAGLYFGLEAVGARVWELLADEPTFTELVAQLRREFDVDADTCRVELQQLLGELRQRGLVEARED